MTNEEASNILRLVATEALDGVSRFVESENNLDMFKQAYEMAIKSLEESVQVVRCKDCRWWDKKDGANYGYCHAAKHGYFSKHWEISIYRTYKPDFYCDDGERRSRCD